MQSIFDNIASYKTGSNFKKVPVLKFKGYDKIVVLLDGRPEVAIIGGETNVFRNVEESTTYRYPRERSLIWR